MDRSEIVKAWWDEICREQDEAFRNAINHPDPETRRLVREILTGGTPIVEELHYPDEKESDS